MACATRIRMIGGKPMKECALCGRQLEPAARNQRYCPSCRGEAYRLAHNRAAREHWRRRHPGSGTSAAKVFRAVICPECGRKFSPRCGRHRFCSEECQMSAYSRDYADVIRGRRARDAERRRMKNMANGVGMSVRRICRYCGKGFFPTSPRQICCMSADCLKAQRHELYLKRANNCRHRPADSAAGKAARIDPAKRWAMELSARS